MLRASSPSSVLPLVARAPTSVYQVAVSRQRPALDGVLTISAVSGSNTANVRQSCYTPASADITDIVLKLPGFYENGPEANMTTSCVYTASIEYPSGTFTQVLFGGATSQTVAVGHLLYSSDPAPLFIPRGTQFWYKLFASWTGGVVAFPLAAGGVDSSVGDWCEVGTGLTDQTLTSSARTSTYKVPTDSLLGRSIVCGVYGRPSTAIPVLGIIGDSIGQGVADVNDQIWGGGGIERGIRGQIPVINVSRYGETSAQYISRNDGRQTILRNSITHLLHEYGANDVFGGVAVATMQSNLTSIIAPYLARGIKVYSVTLTPRTTSSDNWATTGNQTTVSSTNELHRTTYNSWLRSTWQSLGLSGIFDWAHAVDPNDTGVWNADGISGESGIGVATLTANSISAVGLPTFNSGSAFGGGTPHAYATNAARACYVYAYPDDPIQAGGGVVTANCATNVVGSFTVTTGGAYSIPPLIGPIGQWTSDGIHPTRRGFDAMISLSGFGAQMFTQ